jgi:hypothetical protein
VLVHMSALFLSCDVAVCTMIGSLLLPTRFPQATVLQMSTHCFQLVCQYK